MSTILRGIAFATIAVAVTAGQQPPIQVQNGRVENRAGASIDREIEAIGRGSSDPVWVGWRVAMVPGRHDMCSWYTDDQYPFGVRGFVADSGQRSDYRPPQLTPPTGPVPIEAGTGLMVLVRLFNGSVERLRALSDDCPIDAGGRTIYWLTGVSAAESLRFLDALKTDTSTALRTIALHQDAGGDTILDRVATSDSSTSRRREAISSIGSLRGAHGFATLQRLLTNETNADVRRSIVSSIGRTSQPETVNTLRGLMRDSDAKIRGEALYYFAQRGGAAVIPDVTRAIDSETDISVKKRGVDGLALIQDNAVIPALIQLARTHADAEVRKEAVSKLSQSKDPRAVALMQEILKR